MSPFPITLKQLESFVAVAEGLSFKNAANRLNRSQPAITAHVQALEAQLGLPLLHRTTRSVRLSEPGEQLLQQVRGTLRDLDELVRNFREHRGLERGRVRIAASPSCVSSMLPDAISNFAINHPNISIEIREVYANEILDLLSRDEVELGLGPFNQAIRGFDFRLLRIDPYAVVMSPTYHLADRDALSISDILDEPMLLMPRISAVYREVETLFSDAGRVLRPKLEVVHHQSLFSMVEAGLGITIMPPIAVPSGNFKCIRMHRPEIARDIGLITSTGTSLAPAATEFAETIAAATAPTANT
ncbi:MAG: LysR family transcriptional regulator [Rhodospirillaceae bacterium]|nr:LysR family transcriptional regulator [Rhodospirillaceae bacterium]